MIKKLQKYLRNRKGEGSLTFVFSVLLLFAIILFVIDIFRLTYTQLEVTSMMKEIVDVVSSQGGVSTSAPSQFPTSKIKYMSSSELNSLVNKTMVNKGIERGDMTITAGGESVSLNSSTNITVDYGEPIEIKLRYGFDFISIPKLKDKPYDMVLSLDRVTRSKYNHREDSTEWSAG